MSEAATERAKSGSRIAGAFANPSLGARRIELTEPAVLYEPDARAETLYIIESGQVRIYQVGPHESITRLAEILGPGEWFGIAALARSGTYGARAATVDPSILWELPAARLLSWLSRRPRAAVEVVASLASQLQAAQEAAARLVFDDCNQRLVQTLLRFSHTPAATRQSSGDVVLSITHQQLAQAVGAARETVSLGLTQLRQRNLLRTGRNQLTFNPDALQQFCQRPAAAGVTSSTKP